MNLILDIKNVAFPQINIQYTNEAAIKNLKYSN